MELLLRGDMESLALLTEERPSLVRHLLGRLWDEVESVRKCAAVALGRAAVQHPKLGMEMMRRFAWALNDESASNGLYVIPAMAEISVQNPEIAPGFVGMLINALEDPGLRREARAALELIAEKRPELLGEYREEIRDFTENGSREEG